MRELHRPPEIDGDGAATELIRVWLAHGELHVSMLLGGLRQDSEDNERKEPEAWGHLLADLARHVANGLHQSHDWSQRWIIARIRQEIIDNLADETHSIEGSYLNDEQ